MIPRWRPSSSQTGSRSARRAVIAESASLSEASSGSGSPSAGSPRRRRSATLRTDKELEPETLPADEVAHEVVGRLFEDLDRRAELPDACRGP